MLSYIDCVAFCDLTEEEIAAIAEHEHIPAIVAVELGSYLVRTPEGVPMLKRMILDDIQAARTRADWLAAAKLRHVLRHFVETHPEKKEARPPGPPERPR